MRTKRAGNVNKSRAKIATKARRPIRRMGQQQIVSYPEAKWQKQNCLGLCLPKAEIRNNAKWPKQNCKNGSKSCLSEAEIHNKTRLPCIYISYVRTTEMTAKHDLSWGENFNNNKKLSAPGGGEAIY